MIVVTLGDPYSINIEMLRPLFEQSPSYPVFIIGSYWHWCDQIRRCGLEWLPVSLDAGDRVGERPPGYYFLDVGGREMPAEALNLQERGEIAVKALKALNRLDLGPTVAVLTCPIDKYAAAIAGLGFPGQTEFFESLWGEAGIMFLCGPRLRVGLITNHLALSAVEKHITPELIATKVKKAAETLQKVYGISRPRLAICGLNPHCGDHGLFGDFDQRVVAPAIESLKRSFDVSGPYPADTIFWKALHGQYHAVLAMYHDQGLAPLKTVHFDDAVNITGGLKHLRVSPDHGPAQDLFLRGEGSPASFKMCWQLVTSYLACSARTGGN